MNYFDSCEITVFGSCMIDLICYAPRLPKPGETLHGTEFKIGNGGKGANQCVAATKLGASTALVARVGSDSFGVQYKKDLSLLGVNTDHVYVTDNISSGMAQITVTDEGENVIVIVPGANNKLHANDAYKAERLLLNSKVVIFQFEVPVSSTVGVLRFINEKDGPCTIVNGAPAMKDVDSEIFTLCDIFCVNETEAEELTGHKVNSKEQAVEAIKRLLSYGCKTVIITVGKDGALYSENGSDILHVSAPSVMPVDTTGAGDAFIGALAFFIARYPNMSLKTRISRACCVASVSVQTKGTQSSFPLKQNLPEYLFLED